MKKEYTCEQCSKVYRWEYTAYSNKLKKLCPKCRLENKRASERKYYKFNQ